MVEISLKQGCLSYQIKKPSELEGSLYFHLANFQEQMLQFL